MIIVLIIIALIVFLIVRKKKKKKASMQTDKMPKAVPQGSNTSVTPDEKIPAKVEPVPEQKAASPAALHSFKAVGTPWTVEEDRIVAGKTVIMFSDIATVTNTPASNSLMQGVLQVFLKDKSVKTLPYLHKQNAEAEAVYRDIITRYHLDDVVRVGSLIVKKGEHRMRCNVCGKVYCYSHEDIIKNYQNAKKAASASLTAGLNALAGSSTTYSTESNRADQLQDKITDFTHCPDCHSTDVTELTEEEFRQARLAAKSPAAQIPSSADELKKYKDLLDSDVISQEEFDAKKKQILGL